MLDDDDDDDDDGIISLLEVRLLGLKYTLDAILSHPMLEPMVMWRK